MRTRLFLSCATGVVLSLGACGDDATTTGSGGSGGSSGTGSGSATTGDGTAPDTTATSMSGSASGSTGTTASTTNGTTAADSTDGSSSTTGPMGGCAGLGNEGLLFHSTLDDADAVANPAVGLGGTVVTTPMNDFVPGLDDGAVQIDAPGELVQVPQADNAGAISINPRRGTVDFCYQPNFDHTDGGEHGLFGTSDEGQGSIRARISGSNDDSIHLFAIVPGSGIREVQAFGTDYTMNAGEWYRITLTWDFVNEPDPQLHIYLDGVELQVSVDNTAGNPAMMPMADPQGVLEIGAIIREPQNADWAADGLIDDFKVYDSALIP